jgi:hypothetical protein
MNASKSPEFKYSIIFACSRDSVAPVWQASSLAPNSVQLHGCTQEPRLAVPRSVRAYEQHSATTQVCLSQTSEGQRIIEVAARA